MLEIWEDTISIESKHCQINTEQQRSNKHSYYAVSMECLLEIQD